jgi:hypothetical protein
MKLDKAEISEGLAPYAVPANFGQSWDGSEAQVGLKYPGRDYEAKWGIYFYCWIGDGEEGSVVAFFWIKEPGLAIKKLASLEVGGLEIRACEAWITEPVGEAGGFINAIHRALDIWIEVRRKAGGIQQFLPAQKIPEGQAGKEYRSQS